MSSDTDSGVDNWEEELDNIEYMWVVAGEMEKEDA